MNMFTYILTRIDVCLIYKYVSHAPPRHPQRVALLCTGVELYNIIILPKNQPNPNGIKYSAHTKQMYHEKYDLKIKEYRQDMNS